MPVATLPTGPARRARLLAFGAAATAATLVLAGCTKDAEAPEPLTIDVVGGTFPDALESGILEILGENLDTSYSTAILDDGTILVPGSSDGTVDDSVGLLDPTTGEVDWVVTADVTEGSYVTPGDVTERWVTWSVETDEGVTPAEAIPFVFALDRDSKKTYVLADGTNGGGFAPGTTGGRVLIAGDLAVWEGAVPLTSGTDEQGLPFDDDDAVTSAVFVRPLDASSGAVAVASDAGVLMRDDCLDGSPITVHIATGDSAERRAVTDDGALGAVLEPPAVGEGEDPALLCGSGGAVETFSDEAGVATTVVLRGGERDIVLDGGGVVDLQVVGMTAEWAAVWVGDLDTVTGGQLLVHRPTGQVFSLGESESQLLMLRPGLVAFGGPIDAMPSFEGYEGPDGLGAVEGSADLDEDDAELDDPELDEHDAELDDEMFEDEVGPEDGELFVDDFSGGALTTVAHLVAPQE